MNTQTRHKENMRRLETSCLHSHEHFKKKIPLSQTRLQIVRNLKTHTQDTHNSSDHSLRETFEPENYKTLVLQQAAPTPTPL